MIINSTNIITCEAINRSNTEENELKKIEIEGNNSDWGFSEEEPDKIDKLKDYFEQIQI